MNKPLFVASNPFPCMADLVEADAVGSFDPNATGKAEQLRQDGNEAFRRREFLKAKDLYTEAILLQSGHSVLYGNRSAANHHLDEYEAARADAEIAIKLSPNWSKGYLRKAIACESLNDWRNAIAAYEQILRLAEVQSSSEATKAAERVKVLKKKIGTQNIVRKGFLTGEVKGSLYSEKEGMDQDATWRSWKLMLSKLLDGCNKRGKNSCGESVVLNDGIFAKLLQEDEFQRLIYPGIPKEQLVYAPKNLQMLLEDPWYEQELLTLMPKVQAKAASVLINVKKKGADQGDVMDMATERMFMPQVLQEAFGREVLAMVHRVNHQKHVQLANDTRLLADINSDFASWDQLNETFVDELLNDQGNERGVAVMDNFMGNEWTQLLLNDVTRMAKNGLFMSPVPNIGAVRRQTVGSETVAGAKLCFVELQDCKIEYPALAELIEKLHALPYEINKKRPTKAKLCAQFGHSTAIQYLPSGHMQPLRLDCGTGDKDNGVKITCIYFFNQIAAEKTSILRLQMNAVKNASVRDIIPKADCLVAFQSQSVLNEITVVPDGEDLFYLSFWIHGRAIVMTK